MLKYCRNCGEVLSDPNDKTCHKCNSSAVKATAYCRYCGKPTAAPDLTCTNCGAALKPTPNSIRLLNPDNIKLMRLGKTVNLTIVVVLVTAYTIFALPQSFTKPVKQAASDAVMASTGYTALPLHSIVASPPLIPELIVYMFTYNPPGVAVNSTHSFTIYAVYKNTNTENGTRAIRSVDITQNCTYKTSNEKVAVPQSPGVLKATGPGAANITAFYTAAPGTANMSNAAEGKVPVTFTTNVLVLVK